MNAAYKSKWYAFTPGRLLLVLLVVEGVLWLSERFRWLPWHKGYAVLTGITVFGVAMLLLLLWLVVALIFRLRYQFGIRSLLVLTVAVTIPSGWLAARLQQARRQKQAVEGLREVVRRTRLKSWMLAPRGREEAMRVMTELDKFVDYDYRRDPMTRAWIDAEPPGPDWLRTLVTEAFFADVVWVELFDANVTDVELQYLRHLTQLRHLNLYKTPITDAWLRQLKGLSQLEWLDIGTTQVTDSGLQHLKGLSQLRWLDIGATQVTEAGLQHLKGLSQLEWLDIAWLPVADSGLEQLKGLSKLQTLKLPFTKVTDAGLQHLRSLTELQTLDLVGTRVTDAGLEHLKGLTGLQVLDLRTTRVTAQGVRRLREALPNCTIVWEPPPSFNIQPSES